MRICFSVQKDGVNHLELSAHFGESEYFVIFDTALGTLLPLACNPALCRGPCQCFVPMLQEHRFDAVICRSIGARVFSTLRQKSIDVFLSSEQTINQAIRVWESKALQTADRSVCRPEHVARRRERLQSKGK